MMQRKHVITAAAAVVLIAVGVFGGFKIHDAFLRRAVPITGR